MKLDITDYVVDACKARGHSVTPAEVENFKAAFYIVHEKELKVAEEEVGGKCWKLMGGICLKIDANFYQ